MKAKFLTFVSILALAVSGCAEKAQPEKPAPTPEPEEENCWLVDISGIDMSSDKVFRVRNEFGVELARITVEYLGTALGKQAILVYPRNQDGTWKTDSISVVAVTLVEKGQGYVVPKECVSGGTLRYYPAEMTYFYNDITQAREENRTRIFLKLAPDGSTYVKKASTSKVYASVSPVRMSLDGYDYPLVKISGFLWTQCNLKATRYADGKSIPSSGTWSKYVSNWTSSPSPSAGLLYNVYALALADGRSPITPQGWRVPSGGSRGDWARLVEFAGVSSALKTTGTNVTGFSILPAGRKSSNGSVLQPEDDDHLFWTSTAAGDTKSVIAKFNYKTQENIAQYSSSTDNRTGFSVRLVRDF